MPTFRHGKNTYFALGSAGTESTLVNLSTYLMQVQFPRPIDVAETSTFGTTAKTYVVGLYGSTISFTGRWEPTVDAQLAGLLGNSTAVSFEYGPGGNTAAQTPALVKYTGSGFLTSYDVQGAVGDMVGFSVQMQISGAVTRATY